MIRGPLGVVGFPEHMMDADQPNLGTANNPRGEGVVLEGVDMTRERVGGVPVDDSKD